MSSPSSPKIGGDRPQVNRDAQEPLAGELCGARAADLLTAENAESAAAVACRERIAKECMECKAYVERIISSIAHNPALSEDIVAEAMKRLISSGGLDADGEEIRSVKKFFITTARNLLKDAQGKKLKADKLPTLSWDDVKNEWLRDIAVDSYVTAVETRIAADELRRIAYEGATDAQKELFDMWHDREMSTSEIAERLGISTVAVRNRINKLLAKMRTAVNG
ncbi:MAG TPA: sigma-70 family RNA polymerase sigma factor [Pyrinomonadaceae bacterium]|jgi:RNA polymerase sigma factor (sigma-70 family)|nr:sigma-70 family RNA polymerase sigma factor [Pyrinomonadaceae bacterium]